MIDLFANLIIILMHFLGKLHLSSLNFTLTFKIISNLSFFAIMESMSQESSESLSRKLT